MEVGLRRPSFYLETSKTNLLTKRGLKYEIDYKTHSYSNGFCTLSPVASVAEEMGANEKKTLSSEAYSVQLWAVPLLVIKTKH